MNKHISQIDQLKPDKMVKAGQKGLDKVSQVAHKLTGDFDELQSNASALVLPMIPMILKKNLPQKALFLAKRHPALFLLATAGTLGIWWYNRSQKAKSTLSAEPSY